MGAAPRRVSITPPRPPPRPARRTAKRRAPTSGGPPAADRKRSPNGRPGKKDGRRAAATKAGPARRKGLHDGHLGFAVRRTFPGALGWAKAGKLHRDVQRALPAVSALLAAGEPRKNMPRQRAGARADS